MDDGWRRLGAWFEQTFAGNALATIMTGLIGIAVLGWLDVATGAELSFSIFYLLPVSLGAWALGIRSAAALSVVAAVVWYAADRAGGTDYSSELIPVWNAGIRMGYFLLFSLLLSRIRILLERERTTARSDPLTGLLNRRAWEELANGEVERARRYGQRLGVAMIDLDHFKRVNDTMGHDEGDVLLRRLAALLRASLRANDHIGRIGGDEFAVVLVGAGPTEAEAVVHKLLGATREAMAEKGWPVTLSIGAVTTEGPDPAALPELLAEADRLMYEAKRAGRDQARIAAFAAGSG